MLYITTYFLHILLLQHGDIETNPGSQKENTKNLSWYHWNVNSLIAHNLSKLSQLEAYNSVYKHDFICISETFFDRSIQEEDKNIQLDGYNLLRADHPSNSKRGGVYNHQRNSRCPYCQIFKFWLMHYLWSLYTK